MKRHPSTLARPCPDCAENKRELAALRRLAKGLKASLEHERVSRSHGAVSSEDYTLMEAETVSARRKRASLSAYLLAPFNPAKAIHAGQSRSPSGARKESA